MIRASALSAGSLSSYLSINASNVQRPCRWPMDVRPVRRSHIVDLDLVALVHRSLQHFDGGGSIHNRPESGTSSSEIVIASGNNKVSSGISETRLLPGGPTRRNVLSPLLERTGPREERSTQRASRYGLLSDSAYGTRLQRPPSQSQTRPHGPGRADSDRGPP